jgi:hypothetical protein
MHRPETKKEREVKTLCNKPCQQTKSMKTNAQDKGRICETILRLPPSASCGVKAEHSGLKPYKNPRIICHIILVISELVTSVLTRGIQNGEMV